MSLRDFMIEATPKEAQLALSYLIWPEEAPLPSVVDEWVRSALAAAAGVGSETGTAVNLAPLHMTVSTPRMVISLGEPNVHA